LLAQLADGYGAAGRWDMAADTYYLLARQYSDHALADRALKWLVQYYASSETANRFTPRGSKDVRHGSLELGGSLAANTDANEAVQQTSAIVPSIASSAAAVLSRDDRLHRAIQLAEYLRTARPELYAQPEVRFAEVVAERQLGLTNPAKRYFLTLRQLSEDNPWRRCAETEMWLAKPADLPPGKALGACRPANVRPHLDATLDEPLWDSADRLRLRAAGTDPNDASGGEVRLTYDNDYLYVAIRCPKIAGGAYKNDNRPRPRDSSLAQHDRVTLRVDTDRDFTTAFELVVDSRGWTHDACWGDAHWNPNWYVSAATDETTWTIEAAVPITELVAEPPTARHVWAVSASRTIPRVGFQSWTGDADSDSPEQFGFVIFE
jgi:hypothetical protein